MFMDFFDDWVESQGEGDKNESYKEYENMGEEAYIYELPEEYADIFSQDDWEQHPSLPKDFFIGHTFMDIYSDIFFNNYLNSTLESMKQSGDIWVILDNYWSYHSLEPVKIASFIDRTYGSFRDATEDELADIIASVHEMGMKFALMLELNWDVMRGTWRGWDYQEQFWEKSAGYLEKKAEELSDPTEETIRFWNN